MCAYGIMFGAGTYPATREKEVEDAVRVFDPDGTVFKLSGETSLGVIRCEITGLEELDDRARLNLLQETLHCLMQAGAPEARKFIVCDAHNKNFSLLGKSS